jgi:hypothetical protein
LEGALLKHFLILAALTLAACTLPGAPDTNGLGSIMHPSQDYCASRELTLDAATKQCVTPSQARAAPATTSATSATATTPPTAATATTSSTSAPAVTGSVPQVAQAGHSASPGPAAPAGSAAPASPGIPAALPAPAQPLPQEHRAARSVPIEPDALIHRELAQDFDLMYELAHFVRASGYRCDSISALQPFPPARGYKLVCNRFSYKYAIDNRDGRSIVTAE